MFDVPLCTLTRRFVCLTSRRFVRHAFQRLRQYLGMHWAAVHASSRFVRLTGLFERLTRRFVRLMLRSAAALPGSRRCTSTLGALAL